MAHMKEHVIAACYSCEDCNHEFILKADYENHMKNVHAKTILECAVCDDKFISKKYLKDHIEHVHARISFACESCEERFLMKRNLDIHVENVHGKNHQLDEWNCNDCPYQASEASELLNHLKWTAHQPSKKLDKKKLYSDYKKCYTCNLEFEGLRNLMKHRKAEHPSNKKCKNFPDNCSWGKECYYIHEEPMDIDEKEWNFKCVLCEQLFLQRRDFMVHMKSNHRGKVQLCEKFSRGECERAEQSCWFKHNDENNFSSHQVFQKAGDKQNPPDQIATVLQMIRDLSQKMENIEKTTEEMRQEIRAI